MKKIISLVMTGMLAVQAFPGYVYAARLADEATCLYTFDRSGEWWQIDENTAAGGNHQAHYFGMSGAAAKSRVDGFGGNDTKVAKFDFEWSKQDQKHIYMNTLAKDIRYKDTDGLAKYFKVDFKIYTDGEGLEYVVPCGSYQHPWTVPVSVEGSTPTRTYASDAQKPIACLKANAWNEVTYVFRFENKRYENGYWMFDTVADVVVNGKKVASGYKYSGGKSISKYVTDDDNVAVDFLMMAQNEKDFTVYIDDIGAEIYNHDPLYTKSAQPGSSLDGGESAYYIVDEDFMLPADGTDLTTGELKLGRYLWDVTAENGYPVNYTSKDGYIPMRLYDPDKGNVIIERQVEKQSKNKIRLSYRTGYDALTASGSGGMTLSAGDSAVMKIYDKNGGFWCNDTDLNTAVTVGAEYGIMAELDLENCVADIYINGAKKGSGIPLTMDYIDGIRAWTTDEFVGNMTFCPVRLTRGYAANEEFIAYARGQAMPSDGYWQAKNANIEYCFGHTQWDRYTVKLGKDGYIRRSADIDDKNRVFSFKLYSETTIEDFDVNLGEFASNVTDGVYYVGGRKIKTLTDNVWQSFRIKLNTESKTADIQINGKTVAEKVSYAADKKDMEFINNGTKDVLVDDIFLSKAPVIDEYYPTEPVVKTKSDTDIKVGVQVCDLWREGKHYGWDSVAAYPSRKTYLGYYDDGNIEAKDWELKYMAENGIDFAMYTWFAPNGGWGGAIKEPRFTYGSFDAYFASEYRDKVKFAVMWENSGYKSDYLSNEDFEKHFKNILIPYWTEYYFTDPDYATIDGKLVFSIYRVSSLISAFGEGNVKSMIDYLRSEVKEKTGKEMYLLCCSATSSDMVNYKTYGFDGMYAYAYNEGKTGIASQYGSIMECEKKESVDTVKNIPTVSMGRDGEAWTGAVGAFMTPDAFSTLLAAVKENCIDRTSSDGLDRLVMIDNWNEYGEGHFIAPSCVAGFGYLEAVAENFGAAEHTNEKPHYPSRLGHLYPEGREVEKKESEVRWNADLTSTGNKWTFTTTSDARKWTGSNDLEVQETEGVFWKTYYYVKSKNNCLYAKSNGADPILRSPTLSYKIQGDEVVHIRLSCGAVGSSFAQLYFKVDKYDLDESTSVKATYVPDGMTSSEFIDVYFDMSTREKWTAGDTLTQLRFDPCDVSGEIYIESIEILRYGGSAPELQKFSASAAYDSQAKEVVYSVTNPDYTFKATAWAAEYASEQLTNAALVAGKNIPVGESSFSLPFEVQSGHSYKFGMWDSDMKPMIMQTEYSAD